jgi:hypothetical protein
VAALATISTERVDPGLLDAATVLAAAIVAFALVDGVAFREVFEGFDRHRGGVPRFGATTDMMARAGPGVNRPE